MRKIALFLAVTLMLTTIPVHAAPLKAPGYEYTDRDVMNYQILNPRTQVVINNLYTTDQLRKKLGRELQQAQLVEMVPTMVSDAQASYRSFVNTQEQARSYLYQNLSNSEVIRKGCEEFFKVALEGITQGAHNLNDPQKRYEFWKSRGIYDKFTPQQIELINKTSMRYMTILASIAGTGGGVLAAAGLAALSGVSFPILAAAGVASFIGLTAIKFKQMKDNSADLAVFGNEPLGLSKYTGGLLVGQAGQMGIARVLGSLGSSTASSAAAVAGGSVSGLWPMIGAGGGFLLGSGLVMAGSAGFLSILNAGPIPQEGKEETVRRVPSFHPRDNPEQPSPTEFSINYRLTQ